MGDFYGNNEGSSGLKPDNSQHTYCFAPDFDGDNPHTGANYAMNNLTNQTTMTDTKLPDCGDETDGIFHKAQLGASDGEWVCLDPRSGGYCGSSRLRFDAGNITSLNDWKQTACHEVGHSVGLGHGNLSDCMGSSHDEPDEREYDGHHVNHINNDRF